MRKFRLVAAATAALLMLTGCAQLPRSSEIQNGPDIKGGLTTDYLYYSPSGPTDGDGQEQIINGFLNAATGPQNDYQVAREYLTREFSSKWNPNDEVLIQESRPELTINPDDTATLVVKAVSQIDSVGLRTSYAIGQTRTLSFSLVKENNQWRISKAPNVTVLVKPVFDVLFKSYSLYFYDGQNKYLVPDLRWFSSRVSTGTRLVNALLKGPNQWLADSVNNSFPAGTKLAIDAVTVDTGTAVVDLNAAATKADKLQRARMLTQLTATLNQLNNVFSVKIQIDHNPQEIALQNSQLPYPSSYTPMVLDAKGIRTVGMPADTDKLSNLAIKVRATDFGISPDSNYAALSSSRGIDLVRLSTLSSELTSIDQRPDQLTPAVDNRAQIWSLPRKANEALQVHDVTGRLIFSATGWLSSGEHLAFGVSREGGRLAILLKTKSGATVAYVSAIKRDDLGNPVGLGIPRRVGADVVGMRSLSWSGANSLATIAVGTTGIDTPTNIYIGGDSIEMTAITDAIAMVAQVDSSSTYVLDKNRLLFEYRGLSWVAVESDVIAAHYVGN